MTPVYVVGEVKVVLGVSVGHQSSRSDLASREDLEGGVCDDLEGSDVTGVRRHGGRREVSQLVDVDPVVVNDFPVMLQNVLYCLGRMYPVIDYSGGRAWDNIVLKARPDNGDGSGRPLDSVQTGVACEHPGHDLVEYPEI